MPELTNAFYGSIRLNDEEPFEQQYVNLQQRFADYFEEIASCSETDILNATHQARKSLKSYRAFVKLLRDCPDIKDWKSANYLLRDLGKEFSDMRDAHVRGMLLKELNLRLQSPLLLELIEKNDREIVNKEKVLLTHPNHFAELSRHISQSDLLRELINGDTIQKNCIEAGLGLAFHKSFVAYSDCKDQKTEDVFHEWRKRLKDLLNQIKLFRDEEELITNEQYIRIDSLCEEMGMLNDVAMLKEWVEDLPPDEQEKAGIRGIIDFLEKKISGFQNRLLTAGNSFYDNPDKVLQTLVNMVNE